MANLKQSKKRVRQDIKRRFINKKRLSVIKTYIKKFINLINFKKKELALNNIGNIFSKIDKGVNKGVFKKNKANRLKKKLNNKLKNME